MYFKSLPAALNSSVVSIPLEKREQLGVDCWKKWNIDETLGLFGAISTVNLCIPFPSCLGSPDVCQAHHWALGDHRGSNHTTKRVGAIISWVAHRRMPKISTFIRCIGYNYICVWVTPALWCCPAFVVQAMPVAQIQRHEGLSLAHDGSGGDDTEGTALTEPQNNWD